MEQSLRQQPPSKRHCPLFDSSVNASSAKASMPKSAQGAEASPLRVPERCVQELPQQVFYTTYVKQCKPVVIRGAVAKWPALAKWQSVADLAAGCPEGLRVEVQESATSDFVGTRIATQHRLDELAQLADCGDKTKTEVGDTANGASHRYLVQCPIFQKGPAGSAPAPLAHLACDVPVPEELVRPRHVESRNLWLSLQETHSNLHYDTLHNLLCVVLGQKSVVLMAPDQTPDLDPAPLSASASHHSGWTAPMLRAQMRSAMAARSCVHGSANPPAGESAAQPSMSIVFDFDRTISPRHIFEELRNLGLQGEAGRVVTATVLSQLLMVELTARRPGFTSWAELLGGAARVRRLDCFLADLRMKGCRLYVFSRSFVTLVRAILHKTGLLVHFDAVYGSKEDLYLKRLLERNHKVQSGQNAFPNLSERKFLQQLKSQEPAEALFPGLPELEAKASAQAIAYSGKYKAQLCLDLLRRAGSGGAVMLVEDDPEEIKQAASTGKIATCHVIERSGMTEEEMQDIEAFVDKHLRHPASVAAAAAGSSSGGVSSCSDHSRQLTPAAASGSNNGDGLCNPALPCVTHHFCELKPGDALYIPEGWWHHVLSRGQPCTIGVNIWFAAGAPPHHQHLYLLRRILAEALWNEERSLAREAAASASVTLPALDQPEAAWLVWLTSEERNHAEREAALANRTLLYRVLRYGAREDPSRLEDFLSSLSQRGASLVLLALEEEDDNEGAENGAGCFAELSTRLSNSVKAALDSARVKLRGHLVMQRLEEAGVVVASGSAEDMSQRCNNEKFHLPGT